MQEHKNTTFSSSVNERSVHMLELSAKTNLLEENAYRYSLQDVKEPVLYRDVYDYDQVPKIAFNHRRVPMAMPEDIWITDTSFRDGQQSVNPYTPEQIAELYKLMSQLGGPYGIIRQTEFFIYSQRDREAIERCMDPVSYTHLTLPTT